MLTIELKQKITKAIVANRANFSGSDAKYATSLNINKSILSRLVKGETERVLSEANWIHIARKLGVNNDNKSQWLSAETKVFITITDQLSFCQANCISAIYCDKSDIGKTHAAREYVLTNKNAVYVDCSLVKTKQKLLRFIAQQFGVDHTGKYNDVFQDLIWYLKTVDNPLIILDEAGDLEYPAFLELKAYWNAIEGGCGWYMMGADGLAVKIDRCIGHKKVGYTEIFTRFGGKYQHDVPLSTTEGEHFRNHLVAAVINKNLPNPDAADIQQLIAKCNGSLRRARIEITKLQKKAA